MLHYQVNQSNVAAKGPRRKVLDFERRRDPTVTGGSCIQSYGSASDASASNLRRWSTLVNLASANSLEFME